MPEVGDGSICNGCHLARECPTKREKANAMIRRRRGGYRYGAGRDDRPNVGARYAKIPGYAKKDIAGACMNRMQECCKTDGKVTLGCGHELPLVSAACNKGRFDNVNRLPLCTGKVGETGVSVLRDTGCSSGLVRASLVKEEDYTDENRKCVLIDATVRKFPDATISAKKHHITVEQ